MNLVDLEELVESAYTDNFPIAFCFSVNLYLYDNDNHLFCWLNFLHCVNIKDKTDERIVELSIANDIHGLSLVPSVTA